MSEQQPILFPYATGSDAESSEHQRSLLAYWYQNQGYNSKSFPQKTVDLYADCLLRHVSRDDASLRWFEEGKQQEATFSELHLAVMACAECWHGNRISQGSRIAILSASPFNRTVALIAGFRLGLKVSLIPVTGPLMLQQHLQRLSPDYLHCDSAYESWIQESTPSTLVNRTVSLPLGASDSFHYQKDEIVLRLLDPYSECEGAVIEIAAGFLLERLLHDALLILELDRGHSYAGMSPISNGVAPFPELSTLLVGATYFFIEPSDWHSHAGTLLQSSFDIIAIPGQARNALIDSGFKADLNLWKRWIRNPTECLDYQSWREFGDATGLGEIPHADLLYSLQMAGISLGQPWNTDFLNMGLHAPAGAAFHLGDLINPEAPSALNHGRLCGVTLVDEVSTILPTPFMLTRFDGSFRFVGLYPPGRQGKAYPISSVIEVLQTSEAQHAVIERPGAEGVESKTYFILIAFNEERTEDELALVIKTSLGEAALPDEMVKVPLYPRLQPNGKVDLDWVSRLYFRGDLILRAEREFYRAMGVLKQRVYQQLGKRPN